VDEPLFEATLRSVLDQDPGPDLMEILVCDDCPEHGAAERVARGLVPGRIAYHPNSSNLGLAGNWNACIARARGRWVHILHQDDLVLPGFYDKLSAAAADPSVGAAFCQHVVIDDLGNWVSLTHLERKRPGVLENWLDRLAVFLRLYTPSIVVRRDVYESLGGFTPELLMVLDWEMWVRIAAYYPVWYEPTPLACYRDHAASETYRLRSSGKELADFPKGIAFMQAYLGRPDLLRRSRSALAGFLLGRAERLMDAGESMEAGRLILMACRQDPRRIIGRSIPRWLKRSLLGRLGAGR
jgi:glycosyltransferase involved in cell wall biosynthesis